MPLMIMLSRTRPSGQGAYLKEETEQAKRAGANGTRPRIGELDLRFPPIEEGGSEEGEGA